MGIISVDTSSVSASLWSVRKVMNGSRKRGLMGSWKQLGEGTEDCWKGIWTIGGWKQVGEVGKTG